MTGKTHLRVGVLTYIILVLAQVNIIIPFITVDKKLSLAGIAVAGIAALLPDIDARRSMINKHNVIINGQLKVLSVVEEILLNGLRAGMVVGLAYIVFTNANNIAGALQNSGIKILTAVQGIHIQTIAVIIALVGIISKKIMRKIPVVGALYNKLEDGISKAIDILKKSTFVIVYAGLGIGLIIYNYKTNGIIDMYVFGILMICVAIFPHRTFFHSVVEGLLITSTLAVRTFIHLGYEYLGWCYVVGYASHLLLTDMLTKDGIYISVIHIILDKLKIGQFMEKKFNWYRNICKFLNKNKLRIPLMSTGSKSGDMFERVYVAILLGIAVLFYIINGVEFIVI